MIETKSPLASMAAELISIVVKIIFIFLQIML